MHLGAHMALVKTAMIELRKHDGGSFLLLGLGIDGLLEVGKALGLDRHGRGHSLGLSLLDLGQLGTGGLGSDVAQGFNIPRSQVGRENGVRFFVCQRGKREGTYRGREGEGAKEGGGH